jgi:DNA polymerase-3 subunit delta
MKTGSKLSLKHFTLPHGPEMAKWIQKRVKAAGGQFTPAAAAKLAALVGDAPRRADQEILKLLEYVNYARPVEVDDVEHLTPDSAPPGDFAFVDALRSQNTRQAQSVLHKLLEDNEPLWIFASIVSQFRQLILVRELMDQRITNEDEVARRIGIHPYMAKLAMEHARHFELHALEKIYQRLHELDHAIKTGQMDDEVALDLLVIELTDKTPLLSRR